MQCEIRIYNDPIQFLSVQSDITFDLIYMDIDMPQKNGMELAGELRKKKSDAYLVFVSSYSDFVFETFQFAPHRFIRKEKLSEELPESIHSYCTDVYQKKKVLKFHLAGSGESKEDVAKIVYFFSLRHDIFLCRFPDQQVLLANRIYTLEQLEEKMKLHGFIRIHKTYLVNYRYIYQIRENAVLLQSPDGDRLTELPISGRRLAEVKTQFQILTRDGDAL